MKVQLECFVCLLERAILGVKKLGYSDEVAIKVARRIAEFLAREFEPSSNPAILGTKREWIISEILSVEDPYSDLKTKSNSVASHITEKLFSRIDLDDLSYENFRRIMFISAAGNAVEWFIRGHEFDIDLLENELLNATNNIGIDHTLELYDLVKGKNVIYTLDNSGEAVVDLYVVKYLKKLANKIFVGAKSKAVLNDVTVAEALDIGFGKIADRVVATGPYVGLPPKHLSDEFRSLLNEADVVIAKGMGAYETLTEPDTKEVFRVPVFVVLKAKCQPTARHLGVPQGKLAVVRIN